MDPKFATLVESLAPKLESLCSMPPLHTGNLPRDMPASGVYLFTENGRPMYVGRSNVLRKRYGRHCLPGATHRGLRSHFNLRERRRARPKQRMWQAKKVGRG
jgi:hypothetical protein